MKKQYKTTIGLSQETKDYLDSGNNTVIYFPKKPETEIPAVKKTKAKKNKDKPN